MCGLRRPYRLGSWVLRVLDPWALCCDRGNCAVKAPVTKESDGFALTRSIWHFIWHSILAFYLAIYLVYILALKSGSEYWT